MQTPAVLRLGLTALASVAAVVIVGALAPAATQPSRPVPSPSPATTPTERGPDFCLDVDNPYYQLPGGASCPG